MQAMLIWDDLRKRKLVRKRDMPTFNSVICEVEHACSK